MNMNSNVVQKNTNIHCSTGLSMQQSCDSKIFGLTIYVKNITIASHSSKYGTTSKANVTIKALHKHIDMNGHMYKYNVLFLV